VRGPRAWQGITVVDRAHRGHRLGLLVKATNALQTRKDAPEVRDVVTLNNNENRHMLDINRALGYGPYCVTIDYRVDVSGEP